MAAVLLVLSVLLAQCASAWIEALYRQQAGILSFPAALGGASKRNGVLAGVFWLAALWLSGLPLSLPELLARLVLLYFLLLTICTDMEQHVLFDRMQFPFALLALPFFLLLDWPVWNHVLAAVAGGGIFLLLAVFTGGGIGGGDIKLVFVLGLWFGTAQLFDIICSGAILSGLVAAIMLIAGRWQRNQRLAYSPYFSVMAILLLLFLP